MKPGDRVIMAEEVNGKVIYRVRRVESVTPSGDVKLNGRNETFDPKGKEKGKPDSKTALFSNNAFVESLNRSSFQRDTSKIREVTPNTKRAEDFLRQ